MTEKQRKILKAVFADPVRANLAWKDVESLLKGLGSRGRRGERVVRPRRAQGRQGRLP